MTITSETNLIPYEPSGVVRRPVFAKPAAFQLQAGARRRDEEVSALPGGKRCDPLPAYGRGRTPSGATAAIGLRIDVFA